MAEAFFNHYTRGEAQAFSAGTRPAKHTDRNVVRVMREIGIDISAQRPKPLTPEMLGNADKVVTMGCGVEGVCPVTSGPAEDWGLEDPEGKSIEEIRKIRNQIEDRVKRLILNLHGGGGEECRDSFER